MVPINDVSVYGPGQKAIIAWNGAEEILILSTDVRASGDSQVLEILPLPSQPEIEKGNFTSFEKVDDLIKEHFPNRWWDGFRKGMLGPAGEGIEIVFHEKIGAHDITVVKATNVTELTQWAEEFLRGVGIEHQVSSTKLESVIQSYIAQDINFFVFDLIELTKEPRSIEPIVYHFDAEFLYYPLRISTLAEGWTDINLFLLTPQSINLRWLPKGSQIPLGLEMGKYYSGARIQPIQFKVTEEELASIDQSIADSLGGDAWLTALSYHGDLAGLTRDLKICKASPTPELIFDYYPGKCASTHKSQAIIGTFGDTVVAYGVAITPTPCYDLEAELDIPPPIPLPWGCLPTITVNITAREGIIHMPCIECIGEMPFRAKVEGLVPGTYRLIVRYEGEIIGQRIVILPLSTISRHFELPPEAIMKIIFSTEGNSALATDGKILDSGMVVKA
jgi:hypothetical protein